ncbi:TetR/AcrR family transcriptional regulator [Acinetobacter qingfengensis]|uniref:TetR family transcriptional regulator n=1 Tax=Acinetobacter qingfengensis TaxID=1262585 RepID=A0A1E7RF27_9GAMM|nr:TetR/AcrR family transcriptional regulator [Acinetobacter qingfengensis]KAA8735658.1 TetR/AcrR family transcriptional regulator [Acinetobacter qingfengensis]OEY97896.1 TetR family transcriptional regulator [Acinetobacter qingfengensis]
MKTPASQIERQNHFKAREQLIFQTAEKLLMENGEVGMTLDVLASELELAKGTLYKHFQSKDELYLLLILRNEQMLLEMVSSAKKSFPEDLRIFMLHHLYHPQRTVLFHQIEEHLSMSCHGLQSLFNQIYALRKQRLRIIVQAAEQYLTAIKSPMTVRDYLATIWSLTQGAASMLNSSFYQRFLGSRETLRHAYIQQALALPHLFYPITESK